jgi:thiol-disulfide isomerase/thioredoxin
MSPSTPVNARYHRKQWIQRGVLGLVALVVLAIAWDGLRAATRPRPQSNFTATTVQGKDWSLASYRGKKPVIVSFFATWCAPCKMELPHLIKLRDKYQSQGVELVIITRETADVVRQSPEFLQMPVTLITDASTIFNEYRVEGIPHTLMFDHAGKLVFDVEVYTEASLAELEKHLAAPEG